MAGAFTESTIIGTAGNTISRLDLPADEKERLLNNIPVAYAVSYLVGTGFVVWFLSSLAPRLLGVDLKAEGRKLAAGGSGSGDRDRDPLRLPRMGRARLSDQGGPRRAPGGRGRGLLRTRARLPPTNPPRFGAARRPSGGNPALGGLRGRRGATARPPGSGLPFRRGGRGPGAPRLSHGRPRRGASRRGRSRTAPWPRSRPSTVEESSC